jgi:hypothetical protein
MSSTLVLWVERAFPTDLPEHYIGLTFPQRCVLSWGSPFDANCVSYCRLTDKTIFIVAVISMDLSIFSKPNFTQCLAIQDRKKPSPHASGEH